MKRTTRSAAGAFPIERLGLLQRVRIHGNGPVQLVFIERDSGQILQDQLSRGDPSRPHCRLHLGDSGFYDGKRSLRPVQRMGFLSILSRGGENGHQRDQYQDQPLFHAQRFYAKSGAKLVVSRLSG